MNQFRPHIIPVYPADNNLIFEEWFAENYKGCNTDRELLPVFFTSFYVNNNYGNDLTVRKELQDYLNSLDRNKKYFSITQYDDSILEDVSHFDLLRFEMSKSEYVSLPLLCQPHPYKFNSQKKNFSCFVGGRTHPIRNELENLRFIEGHHISFDLHSPEQYCRILSESVFSLCPRGYGINSFRIAESVQYGAIPVYISDDFVHPSWMKFSDFGVCINSRHIQFLDEELRRLSPERIIELQKNLSEAYEKFYTYKANMNHIINYLEAEYTLRQSK